ncbi:carboxylesterase/lipase family protein [Caulobacter segnis]|uniref:Carboxylic ester hydrolase n=1 Tax=Caulobacter segnis TaxID=88688 RepID=A0A2W5V079_9CAUL|nr:carboxylesterase family protein [Caulobacter segnis]PZR33280.1 MAG: carboxylesterase [Caulobacter segnis]
MTIRTLAFATTFAALCAGQALAAGPTVTTTFGPIVGAAVSGVAAFKGVPFAAPPVGALRWRAPQRPTAWTAPRDAKTYGPDCMQKPFPGDAAPLGVTPAEDCLYANVWTPETALKGKSKLPVMVWIYGGGFVNGGSSPAVYAGDRFARDGVVLVSFNYRVGRFGFFAHPALTAANADGGMLGNYGLMDQIAALHWVRDNIAAFGGDPGNVTIFGESAGGVSVHALLTAPQAKGLFHKAIIQSGGGRPRLLPTLPMTAPEGQRSAEASGLAFAAKAGVSGTDAAALEALRALPAETVVDGLNMATSGTPTWAGGPMLDGKLMTREPLQAYKAGAWSRMPVMIGATSADGFFFGGTRDQVFAPFGARRAEAEALYDPKGDGDIKVYGWAAAGDRMFVEPARAVARVMAGQGAPVYQFRFSYVAESQRGQWWGAPHATEIPFVFDTVDARYGAALTSADAAAAKAAHAYWIGFAKTGVPTASGAPAWPRYEAASDHILDFSFKGPKVEVDPRKARLDLVEATVP